MGEDQEVINWESVRNLADLEKCPTALLALQRALFAAKFKQTDVPELHASPILNRIIECTLNGLKSHKTPDTRLRKGQPYITDEFLQFSNRVEEPDFIRARLKENDRGRFTKDEINEIVKAYAYPFQMTEQEIDEISNHL